MLWRSAGATEEVVEMRGVKKRRRRGNFSGLRTEMELNDDTWYLVKETPKVMGFIGGKGDQPAPLSRGSEVDIRENRCRQ